MDSSTEKINARFPVLSRPWFWLVFIGLVLVVGIAWINFSQIPGDGTGSGKAVLEPAPVAGHPAPDFALKTLDGQVIRLSDFKGKPVLVNFWATWCGPCQAEFPDFQKTWVDNADRLVIIGVNHTSSDVAADVPAFVEKFGVTFPIVLDETGETAAAYNLLGLPTSVFIDRDGIIKEVFTGALNRAYIEARLSEM